jgi:hypothetical protein
MTAAKPLASVSLDLDNKWSYLKTHGDAGWEALPTYLPLVVPRILQFLRERGLTITFFVVGQDAARAENAAVLRSIPAAGHEVGNHSFKHEPWLHLYSEREVEQELVSAEEAIAAATGQRPRGFRGPGFSLSPTVLRVLARHGYVYDASTFPTFLGPLARAYYVLTARFSTQEKQQRKALFGKLRDGFRPLRPYRWETEAGPLLEIPVTTLPLFKVPLHASYLLYLASYSPALATAYFRTGLLLCRMAAVQPSFLLHPTDFLDSEDVPELSFFPAMTMPRESKLGLMGKFLDLLGSGFEIGTMRRHADAVAERSTLPNVEPAF